MGTQTLIQALHAMPWQETEDGLHDKDDSDENDADKPASKSLCALAVQVIYTVNIQPLLYRLRYTQSIGQ